jgi:hypothetical protein
LSARAPPSRPDRLDRPPFARRACATGSPRRHARRTTPAPRQSLEVDVYAHASLVLALAPKQAKQIAALQERVAALERMAAGANDGGRT